jgi:hypothetical protein
LTVDLSQDPDDAYHSGHIDHAGEPVGPLRDGGRAHSLLPVACCLLHCWLCLIFLIFWSLRPSQAGDGKRLQSLSTAFQMGSLLLMRNWPPSSVLMLLILKERRKKKKENPSRQLDGQKFLIVRFY